MTLEMAMTKKESALCSNDIVILPFGIVYLLKIDYNYISKLNLKG